MSARSPSEAVTTTAAITAREVARSYGSGPTAVDALRGVSLPVEPASAPCWKVRSQAAVSAGEKLDSSML